MKRKISVFFALMLAISLLFAFNALALKERSELVASGQGGDDIIWKLYSDGKIYFNGSGPMYDFGSEFENPWWYSYGGSIEDVFIGDGITHIGDYAFADCKSISNVIIAESVTSIGNSAFVSCGLIKQIIIPQNVTSIGEFAFASCGSLKSITIPDGVKVISGDVFGGCESLKSIVLPDSVTTIETNAFGNCFSLEEVVIPDSVTEIGECAFSSCKSLKSITIPNGIKTINGHTFSGCESLTEVIIPESVTHIGADAFRYSGLTSITIPEGVKSIGSEVFGACESLKTVTIPESLTESTGYGYVFAGCNKITDVYYGGSEEQWDEIQYFLDLYDVENVHFAKESSSKGEEEKDNIQNIEVTGIATRPLVKAEPEDENEIKVLVSGKKVIFDQKPLIENGRTLVPLRAIFEALEAEVEWDGETSTVTATKGDIEIKLQIGSAEMKVGDEVKILDVPAKIEGGRTMIPVRAISEAFGCNVDWDDVNRTVIVSR